MQKYVGSLIIFIFILVVISCSDNNMSISISEFGKIDNNSNAKLYTLKNNNIEMSVTNYGGIITSLKVPDKHGNIEDIVLGYDNVEGYINKSPYFGAIVGRYGNRIANGQFSINKKIYQVSLNDSINHLHGGVKGFDKAIWETTTFQNDTTVGLILKYLSVDGEQGYPGNLNARVKYTVTNNNAVKIEYRAEADDTTICNLTNHTYFNFKDAGKSSIIDHELKIDANSYLPINSTFIPTGDVSEVIGTPFDFTNFSKIGSRISNENQQLKNGLGYDHNFIINDWTNNIKKVASLYEETSGRRLEIFSNEPGLQFYSGNFLDGTIVGKNNHTYNFRNGLCLETQHFPNSPNQKEWPSTLLIPRDIYSSKTIWKFSIKK